MVIDQIQKLSSNLKNTNVRMSSSASVCNATSKRPKRSRHDPQRFSEDGVIGGVLPQRTLELDGVFQVIKTCQDFEGGINCKFCGKLYKSKVCFTKHVWEHSVYWDLFDDAKSHDRVLSIQAALILYGYCVGNPVRNDVSIASLLVTSPHEKKKEEAPKPMTKEKTPTTFHPG